MNENKVKNKLIAEQPVRLILVDINEMNDKAKNADNYFLNVNLFYNEMHI